MILLHSCASTCSILPLYHWLRISSNLLCSLPQIGADGRRSQVFLALSTAAEFRDHLSSFSDFYSSLGPPNPDNLPDDGKLKSEMMVKDNRRYYLDLKENVRGRFLRVSQTITRGGPRSQIAIPAQGMIEFRDSLTDLLEEFGTSDCGGLGGLKGANGMPGGGELPEGRHMRAENKNFYFDIGQNNRGIYMRISEVKSNFRTSITVSEKYWSRFRDIFQDYCDKMNAAVAQAATANGGALNGGGMAVGGPGGVNNNNNNSPMGGGVGGGPGGMMNNAGNNGAPGGGPYGGIGGSMMMGGGGGVGPNDGM